jgi:hypothetical protein
MRFLSLILLFLLVLTTACTKLTTVRYNPAYTSVLAKQKTVIILPPAAEMNVVDIAGKKQRVYNYEANLEQLAAAEADIDMKEMGFRVNIMHRKDFHDLGIYDSYLRFRSEYDDARKSLYTPLQWEESKAFSITNNIKSAVILGQKTKSDIIVMVDCEGSVKTSGARARDLALSLLVNANYANNADNSVMIIGIVDAKTGNVLWSNLGVENRDLYSSGMDSFSDKNDIDVKKLNRLIDQILKPLKQ